MKKINDEWSVIIVIRYSSSVGTTSQNINVPGFTSEKLAIDAKDKIMGEFRGMSDIIRGVVIKTKEAE